MIQQSEYTKAETNMIMCITRSRECTTEKCKICGWLKDEIREELQKHGDEPQWVKEVPDNKTTTTINNQNKITVKLLETIYEFRNNKIENIMFGLYHIELESGNKYYVLRNGDSFGVICHHFNHPATDCIEYLRNDVKNGLLEVLNNTKK